ncbi:acetate--CoA ligase family protein [uncultured Tateyamaria sp.]|uniref:acetate--CoA ligase family protein n=1 Tax=uncultured Tateyamaria sp. TaxID=455651 RepID=UPI002602D25C|nr:acetate--CoA ligase family protein [uncultured Tateyamaria sp.]
MLRPRSIAVVGGGAWCASVIAQAEAFGFDGPIWPVHPKAVEVAGHGAFPCIEDLPYAPDATFIGVNRHATVEVVSALAILNAGGAVCFASGFSEAQAEDDTSGDLQEQLVQAADGMPILGPNCYGFINALDQALLWPDQHGCETVASGVAILTQSSNIAINLTMQQRALPIAYAVTCGNMAQTSQAALAMAMLDDARVTAIGLHIEGFGDLREWEALAAKAWAKNVPLVALKVGASEQAQQATVSHTASLAGSDAGAQTFLDRLGIPRVDALPDLLETLKLFHLHGPLTGRNIASISCSGGEASLIADMALATDLHFPELNETQKSQLREALGPMVALANPLDYHTYIWRDADAMARAWGGMTGDGIDMTLSIVDYPLTDPSDWTCATEAALAVHANTGAAFGVVATLPELMPGEVAEMLAQGGVVPFLGLREALSAIAAASGISAPHPTPVALPRSPVDSTLMTEAEAKVALTAYGVETPEYRIQNVQTDNSSLKGLFAVKGVGFAHKTEAGAVHLNIAPEDISRVAADIGTDTVLIEEMITDGVAELLVGVTCDPAHGFVLTLGAGGVMTELMRDTASLLLPTTADDIDSALTKLRCNALLQGYRGQPAADRTAVINAILAVQAYILAHIDTVSEVEINPLICTPTRAVAVDALIRKA